MPHRARKEPGCERRNLWLQMAAIWCRRAHALGAVPGGRVDLPADEPTW